MQAQTTSIKIKIGERELEFTKEEAEAVQKELTLLVGPPPAYPVYIPYHAPTYQSQYWSQYNCSNNLTARDYGNSLQNQCQLSQ